MSTETETDDESTDDELGPYEYELEENENTRVASADGSVEPTHLLRVRPADTDRDGAGELYYVDVVEDQDRLELVGHRVGSARSYSKHDMIPLRYREPLEADGWTILDAGVHIDEDVLDEIEAWLASAGVDPGDVEVSVDPVHASIEIDTARYLEGDAWDAFLETMRSADAVEYAPSRKVNYVPGEQVPELRDEIGAAVDDVQEDGAGEPVDETEPEPETEDASPGGPSIDGELLDDVEAILRDEATPDDPVTSGEISDRLDLDDGDSNPRAREAIRILTDERELPIAGTSTGYFMMTERSELEAYKENLDARIAGMEERKRSAEDAFEKMLERRAGEGSDG
jgi:hypothetical protein